MRVREAVSHLSCSTARRSFLSSCILLRAFVAHSRRLIVWNGQLAARSGIRQSRTAEEHGTAVRLSRWAAAVTALMGSYLEGFSRDRGHDGMDGTRESNSRTSRHSALSWLPFAEMKRYEITVKERNLERKQRDHSTLLLTLSLIWQ